MGIKVVKVSMDAPILSKEDGEVFTEGAFAGFYKYGRIDPYNNKPITFKGKEVNTLTDTRTTEEKIELLFGNFKKFLIEKNKKYGDSALNPIGIFSKEETYPQICNRLDDKLSRIKRAPDLNSVDVSDVFGYVALLMIQNDWVNDTFFG